MGVIMHNNIPYGGGSTIEPNPQESATEQLETLGIDGDVYEVTDADAIHTSDVGVANGVAELDANGFVPSSQLPSYVDDVLEYASRSAFPATGETGKIYVALDTNLTYRWGGSDYVEISPSLALGETSSTAYRGDRGKIAYDHSQSDHSGIKPAFTEAATRANIASGETIATIFGKIKKFFSDLKTVAFTGAYSDLSGTPTIPTKVSDLTDDVVSGHYLPLTGGTLTGNLNVSGSSDTSLYTHGNASGSYIGFRNQAGNTTFGYIGVKNDNLPYFYANGSKRIALTSDITDEKVTATVAEPSSETVYDLLTVPHSSQTTNQQPSVNTDSKAYIKQGTAGSAGWVYLSAGNNTPTGTAGNKYGALRLYSEKSGYVDLATNAASTNGRTIRFPDASGVLALTTDSCFTKRFGLDFWLASSMKGKWYTVLSKAYNYSPSQELIIHISNLNYSNSNGTSKMFVVHSHYRNLTIHPIGADANYVSWMVNWRTTYDSSNIYLEFQVKSDLSDSASNQFRISYITLTDNTSFTVPTSLVESSGRTVIDTYTLNENFRTLTPNDNIASATRATQDGDGNTISSTYLKMADVLHAEGTATAATTGRRNLTSNIKLSKGTYFIQAWAAFEGGTGTKGVRIIRGDQNYDIFAESFSTGTLETGYPKTMSCFYVMTVTASSFYVKAEVYTSNNSTNSIEGGIIAFKIA